MMLVELLPRFVSSSGLALVSALEEANIWSVAPPILVRGAAAAVRGKRQSWQCRGGGPLSCMGPSPKILQTRKS